MKRKISAVVSVFFCMLFMLSACGKQMDEKKNNLDIFYLNSDRTGLVRASSEVSKSENAQKAIKYMLKALKKPSEDIDYTAPIPKGVKINSYKLEGEILYLDFNNQYAKIDPLEEKLIRAAVVRSLIQIDRISGLWFTVEGKDLVDSSGKVTGYLNEDDFVQNISSSLNSYETASLTLYFANATGDKLVEQKIDAKYNSNMSREKLIVEKLMKGPRKFTGYPTINPEVTLLSVTIKDEICYVNLDDEFLSGGVDVKPEITIYSIVNSLVEGTTANEVQIMVSGEKIVSYMEKIDLTQPLKEDMSWVEKTEEE
ncbi:GerMN domain-containing protein [Clostridium sp. C105KSO13]|uniref:GerMN domain-containing protein n=1 Tax=Clostridium sp. C105KSO13 TaxID=1776045 RepID=UPI0007405EAD|nr:GerMN domain-containing protein [Clostridium sp. C105KSO13]CUX47705.1 Sporulation and spore germination [Clostridium sp. C105KSO13]